ncbi:hypothetical protein [Streptomyces sp. WAC05374]|uniref:hypothetical protein n=1 Tax=Streptomyces sp. WAC05374 TaxID=2487420 RepID=UPI001F23FA42|nr:hypothetical protein [Streptomyces sp. WAC05374]
MIADEAQDCVPDLPEGQEAVVLFLVVRVVAGVRGEGELEVGAQDVNAGLAQAVVGGVVGESGQGVDAAEPDGSGVRAESLDGLGEAFGVEPGSLAVRPGLINALAAVGDDQSDERAGPGDHAEGELDQVEERLGVELRGGVDLLEVQEVHQAVEDASGHDDRGDEGDGQGPADSP